MDPTNPPTPTRIPAALRLLADAIDQDVIPLPEAARFVRGETSLAGLLYSCAEVVGEDDSAKGEVLEQIAAVVEREADRAR